MAKSNLKSNKAQRKIYLDCASSALDSSANPGAIHGFGVREKAKLESARRVVANILNANPSEIVFTSGATESNNLAILGLIYANPSPVPHIITTNIEHASVLEVCKYLEKTKQAKVTYVSVEKTGIVDPKKIKEALRPNTVLVSVMYANNEIGTLQPIREIAKEIRHFKKTHNKKIYFHTDATQAINYLPISVPQLGVDMMSMNSAKIYGPKGVGALYVKKNTPLRPIMFGGDQEFGLRPGTPSVSLAVDFAKALKHTEEIKEQEVMRLTKLRDYFFEQLSKLSFFQVLGSPGPHTPARPFKKESFAKLLINGDLANRLPNNVNITIPNIPSDLLVIELSARGIMASAKSACKAGDGKASYVIKAIRPEIKPARNASSIADAGGEEDGSLRFSLGRDTTKQDIDYTIKALSEILTKLKIWYN